MNRTRGIAAVMAMFMVMLFAIIAIGVAGSTQLQTRAARNDHLGLAAQSAADAGSGYCNVALRSVTPPSATSTTAQTFTSLQSQLYTLLAMQGNINGRGPTLSTQTDGSPIIDIPGRVSGAATWMSLGSELGDCRITLTPGIGGITMTSYGRSSGSVAMRAISYLYTPQRKPWVMASAGVLTRAPLSMSNGAVIANADVMIATTQSVAPASIIGGARIEKSLSYTDNIKLPVINNGGSVGGSVYSNVAMPSFPTVDTTAFEAYVPSATATGSKVISTATVGSAQTFTNIRVKAGANTVFGNGATLNGVIYIESPNKVSFSGGSRINGIIVTDNKTTVPLSSNQITIDNGVVVKAASVLNAASFPGEKIAEIQQLGGALVLAPNYKLVIAGGTNTFNGALVASTIDISNGYRGIIAGSVIQLSDTTFTMVGGGRVDFQSGASAVVGLYGPSQYVRSSSSYAELP